METVVKAIFDHGAILFGVGFIAPLTAQILTKVNAPMLMGADHIWLGMGLGVVWGLFAQMKGRWI